MDEKEFNELLGILRDDIKHLVFKVIVTLRHIEEGFLVGLALERGVARQPVGVAEEGWNIE